MIVQHLPCHQGGLGRQLGEHAGPVPDFEVPGWPACVLYIYLVLQLTIHQYLKEGTLNQPLLSLLQCKCCTHLCACKGAHLLENTLPLAGSIAPLGLLFLTDGQDIICSDRKGEGDALRPVGLERYGKQHEEG